MPARRLTPVTSAARPLSGSGSSGRSGSRGGRAGEGKATGNLTMIAPLRVTCYSLRACRRTRMNPSGTEIPLAGGNMSSGVVRVGDTVRRPAGPWTPAVHALLAHLHAVGFDGAPRPLGVDERGREVL